MTKPACDSMSNHRRPDSLAHNQSETRTVTLLTSAIYLRTIECVHDQVASSHTTTTSHSQRKI